MVALARTPRPQPQRADTSAFEDDVLAGLRTTPKRVPAKYFYDGAGSQLFERITELPEYYPTRCEMRILRDHAGDIAKLIPQGAALVEFGSGAVRYQLGYIAGVVAQNAHLAARRVIFRQLGDALEQLRAGAVVEIFRRHPLRRRAQARENIVLKGRRVRTLRLRAGRTCKSDHRCLFTAYSNEFSEPQHAELPARLRIEEIAIADARVPFRRRQRGAAQHHL